MGLLAGGSLCRGATLALAWATCTRADDERPHIVLAVVDDLGWSDVGYQGSGDLGGATPHLDALAAEGVAFEALYGAAECTPSRAMLLTGRHAVALGLQDSVIHGTEPRGLDLTVATLADKLRARGYGTSAVGKWHLGFHTPKYLPRRRGFDSFFGILTGGGDHFAHSTTESFSVRGNLTSSTTHGATGRNLWEDDGPLGADAFAGYDGVHTTALYAERALKIVDAKFSSKDPHFLYLAYQAVHGPVQADAATYAAGSVCGGVAKRAAAARQRLAAGGDRSGPDAYAADGDVAWKSRPRLCGMVNAVDASLGELRSALDRTGWARSLLWVASDNGGVKRHGSSNWPLRGQKGEYWEGGVRLASVLAGGWLEARGLVRGSTHRALAHLLDVHATLVAASGGAAEISAALASGANLLPELLEGAPPARDVLLLNRNSATWGGGGALVADGAALLDGCGGDATEDDAGDARCGGRFKLVVENSVGDAVLYRAGRAYLAAADLAAADFDAALDGRRAALFPEPVYHLFDVDADPSETSDLHNASRAGAFDDVLARLVAIWDGVDVAGTTDVWLDDGPLASPDFFGGAWMPWRDENDLPYATYAILPGR